VEDIKQNKMKKEIRRLLRMLEDEDIIDNHSREELIDFIHEKFEVKPRKK